MFLTALLIQNQGESRNLYDSLNYSHLNILSLFYIKNKIHQVLRFPENW